MQNKTPEDEEFDYLEQLNLLRGRQTKPQKGAEESFLSWAEHSHHPQHFHLERKAYLAGWRAGRQSLKREEND